ncbi:hypothetical protein Rcae01_05309 [Novipirellula caenicola]|uniref:Uncharacterized protein n=1 Tax=Novipirellula caenicola TaxID=1536901 RepID=A0ABP9VXI0_9BACT
MFASFVPSVVTSSHYETASLHMTGQLMLQGGVAAVDPAAPIGVIVVCEEGLQIANCCHCACPVGGWGERGFVHRIAPFLWIVPVFS